MLPHPRPPLAGLSSRALLLALAGTGAAVFLFVVFPRLTSSRASERGHHVAVPPSEEAQPGAADELELDPSEILPSAEAEPSKTAEGAPAAPAPVQAGMLASGAEPDQLKRIKTGERAEPIQPGAMRQQQREQRKAREKAAIESGQPLPERATKQSTNPNASRLDRIKGRPEQRDGKRGKKDKPKDEKKPENG